MSDAQRITLALRGKWYGRYGLAFCPAHDNWRTPALRLANGADERLLARCSVGCSFGSIVAVLSGMGLVERCSGGAVPDPLEQLRSRKAERAETEKRRRQAMDCWQESATIAGSLAERYLRNRSITAALPETLRFHGACWHASGRRYPALPALVEKVGEAEPVGVHRIYLTEPGRKADVDPVKASLGPIGGGAVRLTVGGIGTVEWKSPLDPADPLVVAEGVETALSLPTALLGPTARIWATLSTSGMTGLVLPHEKPGRLIIAPDNDAAGRKAATALADRASALGWTVQYLRPPTGFGDWNEALQHEGATA